MEIPALHKTTAASDVPLERLAGNGQLDEQQKVGEAARQFEALLLRKILEETQKTVIHSEFSDDSTAAGIYRDMVTQQLADSISKSGGFGVAKTLERQLNRQLKSVSPAGHGPSSEAQPTSLAGMDAARSGPRPAAAAQSITNLELRGATALISHERPVAKPY